MGERAGSPRRRLRRPARRLARRVDLGRLTRRGDDAPLGLRTAKTTLAAVISWELARLLPGSQPPVLAPLTALLVTQLTLVKTITGSLQRVASVTAGVLLALAAADLLGLHWWSVGLVIFVSLAVGQVLKLGSHRIEMAVSALLVMTLGGTAGVARTRVLETLIGAAVGVLVNAVLVPPVYIRPASEAIYGLADEMPRGWRAPPPTCPRAGRARTPTSGCSRPGSSTARSARPGRRSAGPRTAFASTRGGGSSATPRTSCARA